MLRRNLVGFCALVPVIGLSGCKRPQAPLNPESTVDGLTLEQMQKCILKAAARRGWQTEVEKPGHIIATFTKQEFVACVDIYYDNKTFRIVKNDKTNMMMANGQIMSKYNQWVLNLEKDINVEAKIINL